MHIAPGKLLPRQRAHHDPRRMPAAERQTGAAARGDRLAGRARDQRGSLLRRRLFSVEYKQSHTVSTFFPIGAMPRNAPGTIGSRQPPIFLAISSACGGPQVPGSYS